MRAALLATREARVAWQEALATAQHEPVRHRGISRAAAADAQHALSQLGRSAMLLEAHLPAASSASVPGAAELADALRRATERGAKAVRERRVPDWQPVAEEVARWDVPATAADPAPDPVVRKGATLLLEALEEFSQALDYRGGSRRADIAPRAD